LVLADGEFLWGVFGFGRIGLLHPGTTNWVGILQTTVPASVHCMAVTDEALWLGLDGGDIPLFRIPKKHLLSVPHKRWVPEAISAEDIAAAGSGRPPTAQGVLALFSGNAGRVRDLLEAIPETDLTAEQRFLLALAYDECGLNEPSNRLRNENALLQDFPASIYSRVLKYEQIRRRVTGQPAGPNSFATPASDTTNTTLTAALEFARKIVAAYDLNGDGALDQEELAVAARLEPRSLSLQDVPASAADAWLLANNTLMSCQIFAGANLALRGRVDANMLAAWWQFRANPRSRVGLRPVNLRRPFDSNSMPPAVHQPSFRVNPATNNSLSGASRL
ncbi:MAG TPA: hypothetical protein VLT16_15825, partial [Candidatus Limnocylindrales bacterium]|nr:hypothetical protein [Candidatus Limnocylindrales bacterium]